MVVMLPHTGLGYQGMAAFLSRCEPAGGPALHVCKGGNLTACHGTERFAPGTGSARGARHMGQAASSSSSLPTMRW